MCGRASSISFKCELILLVIVGENALDNLNKKQLIDNPEDWKKKLGDYPSNWLFFEMLSRLANRIDKARLHTHD